MTQISEAELARIVAGIFADRESIVKHNPIGTTDEETLLWMLLSCLVSYLNINDSDAPCFTGRPNVDTYRTAIRFVLTNRRDENFDIDPYLDLLAVK